MNLFCYDKYDHNASMTPIWGGEIVYNESVLPLEEENGEIKPLPLMYKANKIIAILSGDLKITYIEGLDYLLENGKIIVPKNSCIKATAYEEYYPLQEQEGRTLKTETGFTLFCDDMQYRQIWVTYLHLDSWNGYKPLHLGNDLPLSMEKIKSGENFKILFYGDSITYGGDSSWLLNREPFAPVWPVMLTEALNKKFNVKLEYSNTSEGGRPSEWGADNAEKRVYKEKPDICIIGHGMNDGTHKVPVDRFIENINKIIFQAKRANPNCEIIILNTMCPNIEIPYFYGIQRDYLEALKRLCGIGTVIVDIMAIQDELLLKKRFYDMTANNVNHCNDFLARVYAQTVFEAFN